MPQRKLLSDLEFRRASSADQKNCTVRKGLVAQIRAGADGKPGSPILFVLSTADVDRYRDTIAVEGWELENFKRNPAMPWCHNTWGLPVGKWANVRTSDSELLAEAMFCPGDMNPMGPSVEAMYRAKFLNACSVGFIPLKWEYDEERKGIWGPAVNFTKQELTECSPVLVPANPEAMVDGRSFGGASPFARARAAGIDMTPFLGELERTIEELQPGALVLNREQALAIRAAITNPKILSLPPAEAPAAKEQPVATKTISITITGDEKKIEKALEQLTKKAKDHGVELAVEKGGSSHKFSKGQLENFEKAEQHCAAAHEAIKSMRALHDGEKPEDKPEDDETDNEPDDDDKKALDEVSELKKQVEALTTSLTGKAT